MDLKGAFVVALIFFVANQESFAKRSYLITAPRTYRVGLTEKLRVQLFDTNDKWNVTVRLVVGKKKGGKEIARATGLFNLKSKGLLNLEVRDVNNVVGRRKIGKLFVSGGTRDGSFTFADSRTVWIEKRGPSLFIQTDKPIYKPGQKVRMRIIGMDSDLKPLTGKVTRVSVSTPTKIRLMQWDNEDFVDGILSLEMVLSKQPVLGLWEIKAEAKGIKKVQKIKIDKYVLPKFQVSIEPPPFIARTTKIITGSICATYTYGQPVKGTLKASFKLVTRYPWFRRKSRKIEITKPIKGCTDFKLTSKEIGLDKSRKRRRYYGTSLHIKAVVTEKATGITRNATRAKVDIVPYREKLEFTADTPRHIKPGLPFQGRLKVTTVDGRPLIGETVTIEAKSNHGKIYRKVFTVTNGIVDFTIDNVRDATYLYIDARYGNGTVFGSDYTRPSWYATARLYLKPWYSPSNSFLSIERQTKPLKVGRKALITYRFTMKEPSSPTVTMYHSIMCKGELVATGSQKHKIALYKYTKKGKKINPKSKPRRFPPNPPPLPKRKKKPIFNAVNTGKLTLQVTQGMVPLCRLLVYYIRPDGETVADSVKLDVEDKLDNQVFVRFDDQVKKPGQGTRLYLQAAPGSRVAIAAVDKSVHLLRAANELTESKIISTLEQLDVGPSSGYRVKKCRTTWYPWGRPWGRPFGRRRRSIAPIFHQMEDDSSKAFNDAGMIYISNLVIESAKCPKRTYYPFLLRRGPTGMAFMRQDFIRPMAGVPGPGGPRPKARKLSLMRKDKKPKPKPKQKEIRVRKDFPETWLWTEETVDERTGKKIINATVPDTITTWYASAFAMSRERGIGVAPAYSLKVFQPFFVSLTLPYSVIRGEELTMITTVFNYMTSCMTIRIDLEQTKDFTLTSNSSHKLCVCGNEAKSVNFTIVANTLGRIPLTVTGKDVQQSVCKNNESEASIGVIDIVRRKLLVEPEGVRKEYTFSKLLCPQDSERDLVAETIKLTLPNRVVPGSVYATLSAIGDLMGPALEGIDHLLRLPVGCGEQNMVLFAPNIYVMQYLKSTRQLKTETKKKATEFLQIGYQRELTYKRTDGSYSAFGNRDKQGSLWLTAFVLRSFAQARPFIYVDPKEIQHTIEWLKSKQNKRNGCFPKFGRLIHKGMKGGVSTPVTLTAFTVLALIEAGVNPKDQTITRALEECIVPQLSKVKDSYSLALLAYSFAIANHPKKNALLRKLRRKAKIEGDMMYWERESFDKPKHKNGVWVSPYHQAPSADIEMTSYALMASIIPRSRSAIARALPIVRWLSTQRNGLGGFHSTQDTCVGLQSLAQYATQSYGDSVNLRVDVNGQPTFRITDTDRLVLKRLELPPRAVPSDLLVQVWGSGCAVVQADVIYNVPKVSEEPSFNLSVDIRKREQVPALRTETGGELCIPLEMRICARWLLKEASNMAIVKVKLVSGFRADEESLELLGNLPSLYMMRYETEGQDINLYFDKIEDVCFSFNIFQETVVKNTKPAPVTVYDYYEPELSATTLYTITDRTCKKGDN